jgi:hypothetical protein
MNARDKAIVEDIQRFRVLSRDLIADLHFSNVKNKVTAVNYVLKRLHRDKYIERSTERRQYLYYPAENHIKKDSTKVPHFLKLGELYRDLCKLEKPKSYTVEPRYGPSMMEPDVFSVWRGMPWFMEYQRTQYSEKQMKEKLQRYDHYFLSDQWKAEPWQPQGRQLFPYVWIVSDHKYNVGIRSYKVFQCSVEEMFEMMNKQRQNRP